MNEKKKLLLPFGCQYIDRIEWNILEKFCKKAKWGNICVMRSLGQTWKFCNYAQKKLEISTFIAYPIKCE